MSSKKSRTPLQQAVVNLRKRLGMTQRELASALNCTVTAVCRWETSRSPSGASLVQLARFAHAAGEIEISNILMRPFEPACPEVDNLRPTPPQPRWPIEDAYSELRIYSKDYPLIANQYLKLLELLERVHLELVLEAIAALQRLPSAEQARTVLRFQESHQALQEEIRRAKETP